MRTSIDAQSKNSHDEQLRNKVQYRTGLVVNFEAGEGTRMSFYEYFSEQALEILRARAQRAAIVSQKDDAEKRMTALQIRFGSESYALPVEMLRAVYEGILVAPVPCTPAFVAGIANVRGRILPVLNLANLLQVSGKADAVVRALAVVSDQTMTIAFAIERIGEVMTFSTQEIMALPGHMDAVQSRYLQGVLPDGAGLLNIDAILADPGLVITETFS